MSRYRIYVACLGIFLAAIAALLLHAGHYLPFLVDDALISLRYADRLLDGHGLTWTDGQPVEGYSNLLWVLLVAAMGLLGTDLLEAARMLGLASMILVIVALQRWYLHQRAAQNGYLPLLIGLFFFCMAAPVAVWAIGGLEQSLLAALIAFAIPLTGRIIESDCRLSTVLSLSAILGLICLTRPDGPLFTVAALLAILAGRFLAGERPLALARLGVLLSLPVLFYLGQLLFRLSYYGEFVPNTALVKIAFSYHYLERGFRYLLEGMWALFPFSLLALAAIGIAILTPGRRAIGVTLFMFVALWIPYVIAIGGDVFPAHRHLIPVIVVFAFALTEGSDWVVEKVRARQGPRTRAILVSLTAIAALVFLNLQFTHNANQRAINDRWVWDCKVVGLLLKNAFSTAQPSIAVTAAGCLPYWSELPAIDMLGLNDYYLPRHPPADFGSGLVGHELGNGAYVLSRQPDIVIFHTGNRLAYFRSGVEMQRTEEFPSRYTPVRVRGVDPHEFTAVLWFATNSPRTGIRATSSEIRIPAYLFNGNPDTFARPDAEGRLVVAVRADRAASFTLDAAPENDWRVIARASDPGALRYRLQPDGTRLRIELTTLSPDPVEVAELILTTGACEPGSCLAPASEKVGFGPGVLRLGDSGP